MNLPIVIPVRNGDDNELLRYTLRSLVNVVHGDIWIVGYKPKWLRNVHFIPGNKYGDVPLISKQRNVYDNIRIACNHPDIPATFYMWNDDFFTMQPYEHKVEHRGPLDQHLKDLVAGQLEPTWWTRSLINTASWLREHGHTDPLSYELHKPMLVDKAKMADILNDAADYTPDDPPQWRTIYGNHWHIGGTQTTDCKVSLMTTGYKDWPLISTLSKRSFTKHRVGLQIRNTFTTPSPYEAVPCTPQRHCRQHCTCTHA